MENKIIIDDFLHQYHQHADEIDVNALAERILAEMEYGLNNEPSSLKMIPTYLSTKGSVSVNDSAIAIDAGGTNLRIGRITFSDKGVEITDMKKQRMFGVGEHISKADFIDGMCDLIIPLLKEDEDKIGFCFSFPATITPDIDGEVIGMTKEVYIDGIENTLVCREIGQRLKERGITAKIGFVLLNDTVAALLAESGTDEYDGYIGMILGTGVNTCYDEDRENIKKIPNAGSGDMIINMESGGFAHIPFGSFDLLNDSLTSQPKHQLLEKTISGAYLGNLALLAIKAAQEDGLLSEGCTFDTIDFLQTEEMDEFLRTRSGRLAECCRELNDFDLIRRIIDNQILRSSKVAVSNLLAIITKMDGGKKKEKPVCIVMEGSTFYKCYSYKETISALMDEYVVRQKGRYYRFVQKDEATLVGSAKAAILNI